MAKGPVRCIFTFSPLLFLLETHFYLIQSDIQKANIIATRCNTNFFRKMGRKDRCPITGCCNSRKFPDKWVIKPHVQILRFHRPRSEDCLLWEKAIDRRGYKVTNNTKVCSNHFKYGQPLYSDRVPAVFLKVFYIFSYVLT